MTACQKVNIFLKSELIILVNLECHFGVQFLVNYLKGPDFDFIKSNS